MILFNLIKKLTASDQIELEFKLATGDRITTRAIVKPKNTNHSHDHH